MRQDAVIRFAHLTDVYFDTRRNKRYGRDSMSYEMSWTANLMRDFRERESRTFRIRHNYAFLVSVPKWREIMATEFRGRLADHEICEVAVPMANKVLSPCSFNNRKGKGSQAAINHLIENIHEVTQGYTLPARIIKLDLKGYFPSALWKYAEKCIDDVLDLSGCYDTEYLKWLTMVAIHSNPAAHCELRTPRHFWREYIPAEKSLFCKPEGVGAAIGRYVWQTAMGLYINEELKWLTEDHRLHVTCFVDDIVLVVPEHLHGYALALIPELRGRLAAKGIALNERKFYDQPYGHGVEFLGTHVKPWRNHLNDQICERAISRVGELNSLSDKVGNIDVLVASVNSYTGILKNRTEYKRIGTLRESIAPEWWNYVSWDERRQCVVPGQGYSHNERLNQKYHLRIRKYGRQQRKTKCT